MRWSTKFAGIALASLVVVGGAAAAASATGHGHRFGPELLRDGYPQTPSSDDEYWYREGTTAGTATLTKEFGGPPANGDGALRLTTGDQNDAVAELFTYHIVFGEPLATVTSLSYWTYQSSQSSGSEADAAYHLRVDIDGDFTTTGDVTELVYEPRRNDTEGPDPQQPIAPNTWQFWDATNGAWWSTRKITCGPFEVASDAASFTKPAELATKCPDAKAVAFGTSLAPSSPNLVVAADGLLVQTVDGDFTWDFGPK